MTDFRGADVLARYIEQCTNWGRWGDDDSLGTLNHIGPDQVRAAAALVELGLTINCSLPYDQRGPQTGSLRNNPKNVMTATGADHLAGAQDILPAGFGPAKGYGRSDDILIVPNQAGTQWDSLSHIFWKGKMYNGYSAGLVSSNGAAKNGVENYAGKLVMRGVLLDVAGYLGIDALEPGYAISVDELEATAKSEGVEIRPGDALLIRTGFLEARRQAWGDYAGGASPGVSLHTAPWVHEREIAAIASDTWGVEVRPNEIDCFQPFHVVALVHMGLAIGEIFDFGQLARACREHGKYEFLFAAPALPITGASGSPVGGIAVL
ncbi:cyclase family protein [Frankia sp. AgB1.9]|uniref:cyclase family protein n=1 Tax=unclassified Frankia TaxID=2632575 RepID=UPI001932C094|nr:MULTISPECIES: cyclase family protein [unclassified Frankia]MBL7493512.1 cyclase family protein [Frankia sp. AgW1.1]MBL7552747.1 cyclase family protein [Frankia sp. AgB1.9]MBL7624654.1 cyclase family protein [Frankia sp. AgB1.8]